MERLIGTWKSHRRGYRDYTTMVVLLSCIIFLIVIFLLYVFNLLTRRGLPIEKSGNIWAMTCAEVLTFELGKPFMFTRSGRNSDDHVIYTD